VRSIIFCRRARWLAAAAVATLAAGQVQALNFDIPVGDQSISATLNTTVLAGAGVRTESQNVHLIGKSDLNRNVCNFPNQTCQGLFRTQIYPSQALGAAPGAYSMHNDDGDLDYNKGDLIQGLAKVVPDLTINYGDFGFFGKVYAFYDAVNNDFTQHRPNLITSANRNQVGRTNQSSTAAGGLAVLPPFGRVYGPGGDVYVKRTDGETLSQVGTNIQYLESYFFGKIPIPFTDDQKLTFKLGRQVVNWGESTSLIVGSINEANPVNANNFRRIGYSLEEVFTPINMAFASFEPFSNATVETYYQLEWKPTEAPAPGSYFSTLDGGTNNTGQHFNLSFGGSADDPERVGYLIDSPLALLTNTTTDGGRSPDRTPRTSGQYGVKFDYYADWLNNGTDLSFYFENYHSRLPYIGFTSINASCARAAGNTNHTDATDTTSFLGDCPNLPLAYNLTGQDPKQATSSVLALDTGKLYLEYPEDLKLYGFSFNTTAGDYSFQGELAWRPHTPLQVAITDLEFAAAGPGLTNCQVGGCVGTATPIPVGVLPAGLTSALGNLLGAAGTPLPVGLGNNANGVPGTYPGSDFVTAAGTNPYPDTINVLLGHLPGISRSFPNFIQPYRGQAIGSNAPNTDIRGYEYFSTLQFNLGVTRVLGSSDNPIGADQILLVGEAGAVYIPGLPPLNVLQIEGPNTPLSATAGADGSGANFQNAGQQKQACSTNPTCSYGPDGLRFNPHQQDLTGYVDKFSWGYRLIGILRYENVFPSISLQPFIILSHDVQGTSPGPQYNFIAGRKEADVLIETRYRSSFSVGTGYTWFWGGGDANLLSDRDYAQAYVKYQF
jgi:hypothetical protein